ncbi:hypothetical protein ACFLYR_05655 [Chloroflexota bacterium]
MRQCPYCGREAARTEDWACQWCGYPLLSESYKKIPKTYKQLKEERLDKQQLPVSKEAEIAVPPAPDALPPAHVIEAEPSPEPEPEPELKVETEPQPVMELGPESTQTVIELSVEELYVAFKIDKAAGDSRFANKMLKVTGVIDKIVVKDIHAIYYIILSRAEKKEEWNIRCAFNKRDGQQLNQLTTGQTVAVQGNYDGHKKNILMRDCILVP